MKHFLLLIFWWPMLLAEAQTPSRSAAKGNYLEVGFLFGLTSYSGDLTVKTVDIDGIHPGYGAYLRYHFNNHFSTRFHLYSGTISGDDSKFIPKYVRKIRFSSSIVEMGLVGEWFIIGHARFSNTGIHRPSVSPYLFAGIGATFTSAEAEYYGPADQRNERLRVPFPEDGLDNKFILAPTGVGLRADILERLVLGIEVGFRPVFSDDLDGIRYNSYSSKGDWYYFGGLTVSFVMGSPNKYHR